MVKDYFSVRAAVYLLLLREGKVLLIRRFNTGWKDGFYSLVAGHVDGNEPLTVALCREAYEEAGITIKPADLQFAHVSHRASNVEYIDFYFRAMDWEGEPTNQEPHKCDDMQWFDLADLPDNLVPNVRSTLDDYKTARVYSEFGF